MKNRVNIKLFDDVIFVFFVLHTLYRILVEASEHTVVGYYTIYKFNIVTAAADMNETLPRWGIHTRMVRDTRRRYAPKPPAAVVTCVTTLCVRRLHTYCNRSDDIIF